MNWAGNPDLTWENTLYAGAPGFARYVRTSHRQSRIALPITIIADIRMSGRGILANAIRWTHGSRLHVGASQSEERRTVCCRANRGHGSTHARGVSRGVRLCDRAAAAGERAVARSLCSSAFRGSVRNPRRIELRPPFREATGPAVLSYDLINQRETLGFPLSQNRSTQVRERSDTVKAASIRVRVAQPKGRNDFGSGTRRGITDNLDRETCSTREGMVWP